MFPLPKTLREGRRQNESIRVGATESVSLCLVQMLFLVLSLVHMHPGMPHSFGKFLPQLGASKAYCRDFKDGLQLLLQMALMGALGNMSIV